MATDTVPTNDEQLDQLWEDFLKCKPLASDGEVEALERQINREGAFRRALLCTMHFGGKELHQKAGEEDGAYAAALAVKAGQHWINRTKELIGLMEAQILRLEFSILDRKDREALLTKAETELFE